MAHPRNSGSAVRIYFKILDNEGDQQLDGNNINNYFKEIYIYIFRAMTHFRPKNGESSQL